MNSVENRKLFANRDARNRLAEMGGIMASSSELLGEAQMYAEGGDVGVDTYVAVIPGINENRPIRLTVDTLVRLQESFPEIMQQSTVMDLETAVDSGISPSDIRPADAFVERQLSEQMPERAGAASAPVPETTSRPSYDNINVAGPPSLGFPSPLEQAARTEQYNNAAPVEAVAPRVREGGIAGVMRDVADVYAGNPSRTALDSQSTGYRPPNIGATELNTPAIRNALAELSNPDQGPRQLSDAEIVANARALLSPEANDRIDREATDEIIANALGPNSELTSQNGPPSVFQLGSQFNGTPVNINALVDPSNLSYGKRLLETLIPASRLVTSENPVSTESGLERFERQNIEENPLSTAAKRAEAAELYSQGKRIRNRVANEGVKAVNDLDVLSGMGVDIGLAASLLGNRLAKTGAGILNLPMESMNYLQDRKETFDERKARLNGDGDVRVSNLFSKVDPGPSIQDQIRDASLAAIARGSGGDTLAMTPTESEILIQARKADAPVTATGIGPGPNSVPTSASMGAPRSSDLAAPNVAALNLGAGMGDPAQRPSLQDLVSGSTPLKGSGPDSTLESLQGGAETIPAPLSEEVRRLAKLGGTEERKMLEALSVEPKLPENTFSPEKPVYTQEEIGGVGDNTFSPEKPVYTQEEEDNIRDTFESNQELEEKIPEGPKEYFDVSGKSALESGMATGEVVSGTGDSLLNEITNAILGPKKTETSSNQSDTDTDKRVVNFLSDKAPKIGYVDPKRESKITESVGDLVNDAGRGGGSSVSVKDYETKFNELLGPMDKGKAKEKWHQMAMIGFAIAAGQSPDALTNIASGLLEGTKMAKLDRDEANKFNKEMAILQFTERNKDKRLEARLRASSASGSGKYTTERERSRLKEAILTNPDAYPGVVDKKTGMPDPKLLNRFLDRVTQVASSPPSGLPVAGEIVTWQGKDYRFKGGANTKDNYELVG